jgi:acetyltransferase-like isoleucine patch superfamily enzyme
VREAIKAAARAVAAVLIFPLVLCYWLGAALFGSDRALETASEYLSLLPGLPGEYLRRAFLARALAGCHRSACIRFGALFSKAGARIDENVYVGPRCHIGLAHIERDALLGAGVHVTSGSQSHGFADLSMPIREQPVPPHKVVRIGAGAWIGSAAVVMADVGRDTVVGAGAVVTKPLPDRVIAVGVPARVVRARDEAPAAAPGETDTPRPRTVDETAAARHEHAPSVGVGD